jgi:succinylarginine dihydrolase
MWVANAATVSAEPDTRDGKMQPDFLIFAEDRQVLTCGLK